MELERCYIAGPITETSDGNQLAFTEAKLTLQCEGWGQVFIPTEHPLSQPVLMESRTYQAAHADPRSGPLYQRLMRDFFQYIIHCDGVFLLPGWQASSARAEAWIALKCGVPVWVYERRLKDRVRLDRIDLALTGWTTGVPVG